VAGRRGAAASSADAATKPRPKAAGLRLAESTVERATEAAGGRARDAHAAGVTFGQPKDWDWHKDADGKTVAYVAADAGGVGQQGPGGAAAPGRMGNVLALYNPV